MKTTLLTQRRIDANGFGYMGYSSDGKTFYRNPAKALSSAEITPLASPEAGAKALNTESHRIGSSLQVQTSGKRLAFAWSTEDIDVPARPLTMAQAAQLIARRSTLPPDQEHADDIVGDMIEAAKLKK